MQELEEKVDWIIDNIKKLQDAVNSLQERHLPLVSTKRCLSIREAAQILGKSERTIRDYMQSGKLQVKNPGSAYKFEVRTIADFMAGKNTPLPSANKRRRLKL